MMWDTSSIIFSIGGMLLLPFQDCIIARHTYFYIPSRLVHLCTYVYIILHISNLCATHMGWSLRREFSSVELVQISTENLFLSNEVFCYIFLVAISGRLSIDAL